jgi:hypothetical protein
MPVCAAAPTTSLAVAGQATHPWPPERHIPTHITSLAATPAANPLPVSTPPVATMAVGTLLKATLMAGTPPVGIPLVGTTAASTPAAEPSSTGTAGGTCP